MAADDEALHRYSTSASRSGLIPILLFACVHYLVLGEPGSPLARIYAEAGAGGPAADPWPAFRAVIIDRHREVAELMATRAVQTNEVGRSAVLLPSLERVHRSLQRPLALVELGPSAGLNLFVDRYRVDYTTAEGATVTVGATDSPVRLACDLLGPVAPPLAHLPPPVAHREGIDLNPLDVADDDQCRWLRACLWPGLEERAERLQSAIALARQNPPTLHTGSIVDLVADVVRSVDADLAVCLTSTWVLAYVPRAQRVRLKTILDELGTERDLAMVSGEYGHIVDWIPEPGQPAAIADPRGASVLGIATWHDGRFSAEAAGWMHSHGRWLQWLAGTPGSEEPPSEQRTSQKPPSEKQESVS